MAECFILKSRGWTQFYSEYVSYIVKLASLRIGTAIWGLNFDGSFNLTNRIGTCTCTVPKKGEFFKAAHEFNFVFY